MKATLLPGVGLGVESVTPGSPADAIGLQAGMVVVGANGVALTDETTMPRRNLVVGRGADAKCDRRRRTAFARRNITTPTCGHAIFLTDSITLTLTLKPISEAPH